MKRIIEKLRKYLLTPRKFVKIKFREKMGISLDLDNPRTFNEKIQWLKLYDFTPEKVELVDKVLVKSVIESKIGAKYLIPTIKVYKDVKEMNFSELPKEFILKANHGSGWNFVCFENTKQKEEEAKNYFKYWLKKNYYPASKEKPYKYVDPRVICEPLLRDENDELPMDYKVMCFGGEPKFIQVDVDRYTGHKRALFDFEWNKMKYSIRHKIPKKEIERPACLNEMYDVAKKLSNGYKFVRVDLYVLNNKVYFGEMTFYPGGDGEDFTDHQEDWNWGKLIRI